MSNRIILYHGAVSEVKEPLTHVGRPELDFGSGFYLTKDKEQAENWAKTKQAERKTELRFSTPTPLTWNHLLPTTIFRNSYLTTTA
jgi:hypothetical protein